jgi:hypothetical protein
MINLVGGDDLREQSWRGNTGLLQCVQQHNEERLVRLIVPHMLFADDAAASEPRGFVFDLFGYFLTNMQQG